MVKIDWLKDIFESLWTLSIYTVLILNLSSSTPFDRAPKNIYVYLIIWLTIKTCILSLVCGRRRYRYKLILQKKKLVLIVHAVTMQLTALHDLALDVHVKCSGHHVTTASGGQAARAYAVHEETARRRWPRPRCHGLFQYLFDGVRRVRLFGRARWPVGPFAARNDAWPAVVMVLQLDSFVVKICVTYEIHISLRYERTVIISTSHAVIDIYSFLKSLLKCIA